MKLRSQNLELHHQFSGSATSLLEWVRDPSVSDLLINGVLSAYVERGGHLCEVENPFLHVEEVFQWIERVLIPLGKRFDVTQPYVDGKLADGSRFHVIFPPVAKDGPLVSIRRPSIKPLDADFGLGHWLERLCRETREGKNLLIVGGTGSGKTTLLHQVLESLPREERIIILEETSEILCERPHTLHLECRNGGSSGRGEVTLRHLLRQSLRMRPDRLILGEVRGEEAFDLLQALNTGHGGSVCTLHGSSARGALRRLESLAILGGGNVSTQVIRSWVAEVIHRVVVVSRVGGQRRVESIEEVRGLEGQVYRMTKVFSRESRGPEV